MHFVHLFNRVGIFAEGGVDLVSQPGGVVAPGHVAGEPGCRFAVARGELDAVKKVMASPEPLLELRCSTPLPSSRHADLLNLFSVAKVFPNGRKTTDFLQGERTAVDFHILADKPKVNRNVINHRPQKEHETPDGNRDDPRQILYRRQKEGKRNSGQDQSENSGDGGIAPGGGEVDVQPAIIERDAGDARLWQWGACIKTASVPGRRQRARLRRCDLADWHVGSGQNN